MNMDIIHGEEDMLPRVSSVKAEPDYTLIITFKNGERKKYDAKPLLNVPMYRNLAKVFCQQELNMGQLFGRAIWTSVLTLCILKASKYDNNALDKNEIMYRFARHSTAQH